MLTIFILIALGLMVGLMVLQAMLMFSIGTTLDDVIEGIKDVRQEIRQLREDLILNSK
jgi:hypothetical protein